MKMNKKVLEEMLKKLQPATLGRGDSENALGIEIRTAGLSMWAQNGKISARIDDAADEAGEPFAAGVNYEHMKRAVAAFEKDVEIIRDGNALVLKEGAIVRRLGVLNQVDDVKFHGLSEARVESGAVWRGLFAGLDALCDGARHPVMEAVHLKVDAEGNAVVEAGSGHRIARRAGRVGFGPAELNIPPEMARIIAGSGSEALKICTEKSRHDGAAVRVVLQDGPATYASTLLHGQYPDVDKLANCAKKPWLKIDRDTLAAAVERFRDFKVLEVVSRGLDVALRGRKGPYEASDAIEAEDAYNPLKAQFATENLRVMQGLFSEGETIDLSIAVMQEKEGEEFFAGIVFFESKSVKALAMTMKVEGEK